MAQKTPTQLKNELRDHFVVDQNKFADLVDSALNPLETAPQGLISPLTVSNTITANSFEATNLLSANVFPIVNSTNINCVTLSYTGTISGNGGTLSNISINSPIVTTPIIKNSVDSSVAANGLVQIGATPLNSFFNIITTADPSNNAVIIGTLEIGQTQEVFNNTSELCFLFPTAGATINNLAADAPFTLTLQGLFSITRTTSNSYVVG